MISVHPATYPHLELLVAINRLLPQLSTSASPMSHDDLERLLASNAITLFVATLDDHIVGLLTLALFPLPTGLRAWIEDVVVDEEARGQGVASELVLTAVAHAERHEATTVDLTSRPSREAANRLYQKLGFSARETNVYRLTL